MKPFLHKKGATVRLKGSQEYLIRVLIAFGMGMATLARRVGGMGLGSVIAMTGHKDIKLADHYSKIDSEVQKETSIKIMEHISKSLGLDFSEGKKGASKSNKIDLRNELEKAPNVVPFRRIK